MQTTKKATRKLDKLRRLSIPKKFRREMEMSKFQQCEITIEYGKICIKKFTEQNISEKPYIGIVRKLDDAGRISVPKEYIDLLKIPENAQVNLLLDGNKIIIL